MNRPFSLILLSMLAGFGCSSSESPDRKNENGKGADVQVGDWVEFRKSTLTQDGQKSEGDRRKLTVVAVDAEMVKVREEFASGQVKLPFDVDWPRQVFGNEDALLEMVGSLNARVGGSGKGKELGRGEEALEIAGKSLRCKWIKTSSTVDIAGTTLVTDVTVWFSRDVPLGGMVKTQFDGTTTTAEGPRKNPTVVEEIVDFGRGK